MIEIVQFGAGRIGQIHAANLAAADRARLRHVVDIDAEAAKRLTARHGGEVSDVDVALSDPAVGAVIIASSTDTHAELIEASARAGKAIFCEKPIDLDLARVEGCLAVAREAGVLLQVGFNRRFDPSMAALKRAIDEGRIGRVETVIITSRDPEPPPLEYLRRSGGLFRDMTIHDFDMARWLLGAEPVRLHATASRLFDPAAAEAGDHDTAAITLVTEAGQIAVITNSRRAVYGYDQRLEVLGSDGMLRVANRTETTFEGTDADGVTGERPLDFFLQRYAEAYRLELEHFLACLLDGAAPRTTAEDGRRALLVADAAYCSVAEGRMVEVGG